MTDSFTQSAKNVVQNLTRELASVPLSEIREEGKEEDREGGEEKRKEERKSKRKENGGQERRWWKDRLKEGKTDRRMEVKKDS